MMSTEESKAGYVVCLKNDGYAASLEVRKIYRRLPDAEAAEHRMLRVVDESGEDYLYPSDYFAALELPQSIAQALDRAA